MATHDFIINYLLRKTAPAMNMADLSLGAWGVGGFHGPNIPCSSNCGCTISGLKVSGRGVSFHASGNLDAVFTKKHTDGDWLAIAGFFCWIDSPRWGEPHWFGGKVEWCRKSKCAFGIDNAKDYNGWGWNAITSAKKFGLVLCSHSGGAHTNFIECDK